MRVRILSCSHDQNLPLNINGGVSLIVPVHGDGSEDGASEIPEAFLPVLDDSHVEYEIVAPARDEAGEGAGGDSGEPPAEPSLLDLSIPKIIEKLPSLSREEIEDLLASERAGKTRSTLISALEEALNPPEE